MDTSGIDVELDWPSPEETLETASRGIVVEKEVFTDPQMQPEAETDENNAEQEEEEEEERIEEWPDGAQSLRAAAAEITRLATKDRQAYLLGMFMLGVSTFALVAIVLGAVALTITAPDSMNLVEEILRPYLDTTADFLLTIFGPIAGFVAGVFVSRLFRTEASKQVRPAPRNSVTTG